MSRNSSNSSSNGIGFGGMLTLLFIGLKILHKIDWSWWWVLSPIWISMIVIIIILIAVLIFWKKW